MKEISYQAPISNACGAGGISTRAPEFGKDAIIKESGKCLGPKLCARSNEPLGIKKRLTPSNRAPGCPTLSLLPNPEPHILCKLKLADANCKTCLE